MEKQIKLTFVGQQVTREDIDTLGESAALADDKVFAEIFGLGNLEKAVLCRRNLITISNATEPATISVAPFRALVGSRGLESADPRAFHVDARSAVCVGSTTAATSIVLPAPPDAIGPDEKYRWDLIYATLTVDATGPTDIRKVKDPTTAVVAASTVPEFYRATCTVSVLQGVQAVSPASPALPSLPADTATTFYIPLAYVGRRNTTSVFYVDQIYEVAPMAKFQNQAGGPVNSAFTAGGSYLTTSRLNDWPKDVNRPRAYLPPSFGSKLETVVFACNTRSGGAQTHTSGQIIDTRDWRNRVVRWFASVRTATTDNHRFAWEQKVHTQRPVPWGGDAVLDMANPTSSEFICGMGETFTTNPGTGLEDPIVASILYGGAQVAVIRCDRTTGNLKVEFLPTNAIFVIWMDFTNPYPNGPT